MTNQSSVGERKEKAKAMREERKSRSGIYSIQFFS